MRKFLKKPVPLKSGLDNLIRNLGIDNGILQGRAFLLWNEAVGEINAKKTEPIKIERGKLFVKTTDSCWRQELYYQKDTIIKKINLLLKKDFIKDIIFY